MSTLGSWIDQDELDSLAASLVPAAGVADSEEPVSDDEGEGEFILDSVEEEPAPSDRESSTDSEPSAEELGTIVAPAAEEPSEPEAKAETDYEEAPEETEVSAEEDETPEESVEIASDKENPEESEASVDEEEDRADSENLLPSEEPANTGEPEADGDEDSESDSQPTGETEASPQDERIDYDAPAAYEAAAFPAPQSSDPESPLRRAAAVQAAEALEKARNRAQEGGLLRPTLEEIEGSVEIEESEEIIAEEASTSPVAEVDEKEEEPAEATPTEEVPEPEGMGEVSVVELSSPTDPTIKEEATEIAEAEEEEDLEAPLPEALETPFSDEFEPDLEDDFPTEDNVDEARPEPDSLRARLRDFVQRCCQATGTDSVAVTDHQGYPLLSDPESPPPVHSAIRLGRHYGTMAEMLSASADGATQISIGDQEWLCVIVTDSASGGACASFRRTEILSDEVARDLIADLRATLTNSVPAEA